MQNNLRKLPIVNAVLGFIQLLHVLVSVVAAVRSNSKFEQGSQRDSTSPRLFSACNRADSLRKVAVVSTTKLRSISTIVGILLVAMLLNIAWNDDAMSQHTFEFRDPNTTSGELAIGPGGLKTDLLINAGTWDRYDPIKFYRWHNKFGGTCIEIAVNEYIDGVLTPGPDNSAFTRHITNNNSPLRWTFTYLTVELGNIVRRETHAGFAGVGDNNAEGFGTIRPSLTLNSIRNQVVKYEFIAYYTTGGQGCPFRNVGFTPPSNAAKATIEISRKHVGIEWDTGVNGEITSGVYRGGTTEYPVTRAKAFTSLRTNSANGHTFVFRATEGRLGRPGILEADWMRDNPTDSWYIGRNKFQYGDWKINHRDDLPTDDTSCRTGHLTYINCFTVLFRPNKQAIDSLYGTVTITLEIAHVRADNEYMKRTLTLTINGRSHIVPQVSMVETEDLERGLDEGESGTINIYFTRPPAKDINLAFSIAETGNFIAESTLTKMVPEDTVSTTIMITTVEDDLKEDDGMVTVSIDQPTLPVTAGWTKTLTTDEQSVTFAVRDNDVLITNIITHDDSHPSIYELPLNYAKFRIRRENDAVKNRLEVFVTVRQQRWNNVLRRYDPTTNLIDPNWIDPISRIPRSDFTRSVFIEAGKDETTLAIKTHFDSQDQTNTGRIEVTLILNPNPGQSNSYAITSKSWQQDSDVDIFNNDVPIIFSVTDTNLSVVENITGGIFIFDVGLSVPAKGDATFSVAVSSGTATKDTDFLDPVPLPDITNYRIQHNLQTTQIAIPITNDVETEGNETFNVIFSDLLHANFPTNSATSYSAELTIIDDEKPVLTFANSTVSINETDEDTNVDLTLNISRTLESAVDISYVTVAETATDVEDFIGTQIGTTTIAANTTSATISIPIKGDDDNEGNETFKVRIASPPDQLDFAAGISTIEATVTIIDDEVPIISIENSSLRFSESAGPAKIRLSLSEPSSNQIVVKYLAVARQGIDTAESADFTGQSTETTLPIAAESTSAEIEIPIMNDAVEEGDETFTLELVQVSGAVFARGIGNTPLTVTIVDDEGLPTLTIDSNNVTGTEANRLVEVGFTLSTTASGPVTITYSTTDSTAKSGTDFESQTNATVILSTGTSGKISIPIIDDNIHEGNETFTATITEISGAAYGTGVIYTPISVTITDNEAAPVIDIFNFGVNSCENSTRTSTNISVSENVENLIVNINFDRMSQIAQTIVYKTDLINNSATALDFYHNSANSTVTLNPENLCTEIVVPITQDELAEDDEQFELIVNDLVTFTVTIVDDDSFYVTIEDTATPYEGDHYGAFVYLYPRLNRRVPHDVSVNWRVSTEEGDTATYGVDYPNEPARTSGVSTIRAGNLSTSFYVGTIGDTINEGEETFTVTLSNPTGGATIRDGVATVTIRENDPEPIVRTATNQEVDEDIGTLVLNLNITNQTTKAMSFKYSTTDGTATGGTDSSGDSDFITQSDQTHTIPALARTSVIEIPIIDNMTYEADETFTITLSDPVNLSFDDLDTPAVEDSITINVTINENDPRPTLAFDESTTIFREDAGTVNVIARIAPALSSRSVAWEIYFFSGNFIDYFGQSADITIASPDGFEITTGSLPITEGATMVSFPFTIIDDAVEEGIEFFELYLIDGLTTINTNVYIVDDDVPTLDFNTTNFSVSESVSGGNFDVEVELSESPTSDVTFNVELSDGTAIKDTDYEDPTDTSITITSGATGQDLIKTISIPITSDTDNEGNETFIITLKNLTNATFTETIIEKSATITILDDENPVIKFTNSSIEVDEDVGTANLEISLSGTSTTDVTVTFAASTLNSDEDATATDDFMVPMSTTATILANQLTGLIPITIVDDELLEYDERFTVTISSPSNNAILSPTAADLSMTVTIKNDDIPELTIEAMESTKEGTTTDDQNNQSPKTADFKITSDILIPTNLTIQYLPVGDSFLPFGVSNQQQIATSLTFAREDEDDDESDIISTLKVDLDDDERAEANGTVTVTLLPDSSTEDPAYTLSQDNSPVTVNVEDDDAKIPVLTVSAPTSGTPESAGAVEFTVTAYDVQAKTNSINPGRPITIKYTPAEVSSGDFLTDTVAGTATTTILDFREDNGTWIDTFTVDLDDDSTVESTGKVKVTLNNDPATIKTYNVSTGADKAAEATIWDDDAPELTIAAGTGVTEGPNVKARFRVISNVLPKTALPIQFTPVGEAFVTNSGTKVTDHPAVSFQKNELTGKYEGLLEIDIVDDDIDEPNGNVTVTLNAEATITNYSVGTTNSAMVAVADDDLIPIISVNNVNLSVAEGETVTIPVNLSNPSSQTVEVDWATSTSGGTAEAGDFTAGSGTLEISSGVTGSFQIQTNSDTDNDDETFKVTLTMPEHAKFSGTTTSIEIIVTILEDDIPVLKFTNRTMNVQENVTGGMVSLGLSLDQMTTEEVTVRYITSSGQGERGATTGLDFTGSIPSSNTATIMANSQTGTIQIPILNDAIKEYSENFTVTLSNPQNAILANDPNDITITVKIIDDERATLTFLEPTFTGYETDSETNVELKLRLNYPIEDAVDISYVTVAETANDGKDFTGTQSGVATIAANTTSTTIRIPIKGDNDNEANETFKVRIATPPTGVKFARGVSVLEATATIIDDEGLPTLSLASTQVSVAEESKLAEIGLSLTNAINAPISITYTIGNDSAENGTDFELPAQTTYTISSSATGTIGIPIIDDKIHEGNETFTVTITKISGANYGSGIINNPITVTIIDDEMPPTFTIGGNACDNVATITPNISVMEGAGVLVLNATLSHLSQLEQTYQYRTIILNQTAGATDFGHNEGNITVTIPPNTLCGSFGILITQDNTIEKDEQFQIAITTNNSEFFTVTIIDDEDDTIFVSAEDVTGTSGEDVIYVPIRIDKPVSYDFSVNWRVSTEAGNTATFGVDYPRQANGVRGVARIIPGLQSSSIPFRVVADSIHEGNETFTLTISDPTNGALLRKSTATITIPDDDPEPTVTVAETLSVDENAGNAIINVRLSNPTIDEITLQYSTMNDTATGGSDFMSFTNQTHTIPALARSSVIEIPITDDATQEANETLKVRLSNVTNATFDKSNTAEVENFDEITITINYNDGATAVAPAVAFDPATLIFAEDAGQVNVRLNFGSTTTSVTGSWHIEGLSTTELGTASATDFTGNITDSLVIPQGQTSVSIPITLNNDTIEEGIESFQLRFNGGSTYGELTTTIYIIDDGDEALTLDYKTTNFTVSESVSGGTFDVQVEVPLSPIFDITFDVELGGGTATKFSDYFNPPRTSYLIQSYSRGDDLVETISIPIALDSGDEDDETFTISIINLKGAKHPTNVIRHTQTITITDDDTGTPELTISTLGSTKEAENGVAGTADFLITSTVANTSGLILNYLPVGDSFLPVGIANQPQIERSLTFTPVPQQTTSTATLRVPLDNDSLIEANGTVMVTLLPDPNTGSISYTLPTNNISATVNVEDDDALNLPVLSISAPTSGTPESAGSVTFTVTAYEDQTKATSINPGRSINVKYTPDEVSPGDFLTNSVAGTAVIIPLTFIESDGKWFDTFTVNLHNDTDVETTGEIMVTLNDDPATPKTYNVSTGADKSAEATIWDDDAPELTIVAGPTVTEGENVKAKFKVISNVMPKTALPIQYTPVGAEFIANSGVKITANPAISFEKNSLTGKFEGVIEIDIVNDNLKEPDGNVTVTLNNEATLTNYSVGTTSSATVAVSDDDPIPSISVKNLNLSVIEGGTVSIPVALSNQTSDRVRIAWATSISGGTASANDFPAGSGNLQINSGLTGTIQVQTTSDTEDEENETFFVTLSSPQHARFLGEATSIVITVTIVESDVPTVKFTQRTASVSEIAPNGMVTLGISLDKVTTNDVTVRYTTSSGSGSGAATAGADYTASQIINNKVSIVANQRTGEIQIPILDDLVTESIETFFVTLSNPLNAVLANDPDDLTITVSILDDESIPVVSIEPDSGEVSETGPAKFKLTATGLTATETLTIRATPAEDGADFLTNAIADTEDNFDVEFSDLDGDGKYTGLLSVTLYDDSNSEPSGDIKLTLNADDKSPITYQLGSTTEGTITVIDNDGLTLSIESVREPEGDGSTKTMTFTVTASSPASSRITVNWATSIAQDDNATEDSDFRQASGTAEFLATESADTFTVTIIGDDMPEPDESFTVTLSNPSTGAQIGNGTAKGIITNDDGIGLSISTARLNEGGTGDNPNMTFTVDVVPPSSTQITYDWATSDDAGTNAATAGTDYTAGSGNDITIAANSPTSTFTVALISDDAPESDETFTVTLSDVKGTGARLITASAQGIIINDDGSGLSIAAANLIEGAHGVRSQMAFTVSIDPPVSNPIYFDWRTSDDSGDNAATAGTDYTATTQTGEMIPANARTHAIRVPIIGDNDPEFDETFTVTLSNVSGAALVTTSAQGTITNDDGSLLTIESEAIDEGVDGANTAMTFTVTATPPATSDFSVNWGVSIVDGVDEAIIGTDLNSANGRLDFENTNESKTFSVTIRGDNTPEPDETFTVTLSNATDGAKIDGNGTAKGTITNDDGSGLSIADMSLVEGNGATTQMMFRVSVIPTSSSPITYSWATSNNAGGNAATAGTDYTATTRSNVNIAANASFDTISVPIIGDNTPEPDETFTVTLSNVTGGSLIKATALGTITNDDGSTLSIASVEQAEGTSADTTMTFTITASPPATTGFTVRWGTSIAQGDEATAGADFTTASDTAVFNVGDDEQTFTVNITGDNIPEPNETFTVTLSNASVGAQISTQNGSATGTINNDDGHGVRISTASVAEGDSGDTPNMTFTVEVVPKSATAITFDWETSDDSTTNAAMAGSDYTASNDEDVRIPPNTASVTITVPITGDNDPELDETFTVTLSDVSSGARILVAAAQGTILNDDGSTLTIAPVSQAEGTSADTMMTFTITATPTPTSNFSVEWETSVEENDRATAGTDFTTESGTANFTSGNNMETFTVTIKADNIPEFDETFTVILSEPSVGALVSSTNGSAKGKINNDDGHGIRIADVSKVEGATTNNLSFTVEAVPKSTTPITFNWTTAADTSGTNPATAGSDFTTSNRIGETISANSPSVTINVPILGDNDPEFDETFLVNLSNATSGVQILDGGTAKGTILNDDGSSLSIAMGNVTEGADNATTTMTFTITATPPAANRFTVDWATSIVDGTDSATADSDFMSASDTATFDKNDATETFTVTIIGDNDPEVDETFTVTLTNPGTGGQLSANNSAQGRIENDDGHGIRIADVSMVEGATTNNMSFTVEAVPPSSTDITFDWRTSPDTTGTNPATADSDFTTTMRTGVIITASTPSVTIDVPILGDNNPEYDETFFVNLSNATSGVRILDDTAKGTIRNDDGSTLTIEPVSLPEGADDATSTMTFMVTAIPPATSMFTVLWETDTGTGENPATEDDDYTSASGTLTFNDSDSAKPIEILIRGDNTPEFDETFVVTLSNAGAGSQISRTKGSAQGTITNDDGHGIRIADVSMAEGSTTNNMMFTVEAVPKSSNSISFDWTTANDTGDHLATVGTDYTASNGDDITISANTASVTINVPIIGDSISEYDETFVVNLSDATGAILLNTQATGTIANDDGTTIHIDSMELAEGASTDRNMMRFTVTATPPISTGFSANWETRAGTGLHLATKNVDYSLAQSPLNFGAGVATQMIDVTILGDDTPEFNETFNIALTGATNGVKVSTSNGSAQGTITNDDGIGLRVAPASKIEGNTGPSQMEFTVSVIPTSSTPITYDWATSNDSGENVATAGTDYTASIQTGVMIAASAPSDTFSVPIIGDNAPEFDETFVVTISNPSSGVKIIDSAGTAKGTITNDDGSELTIESVAIPEGTTDQTSKIRFTVTASPPATTGFTVNWATSNIANEDLATIGTDYTSGSGMLTFAESDPAKTFEVDIKGDNTPEPDETFTVTLTNVTSGAIISTTKGSAKGTITNDDGSELTIEDARLLEGGDGDKNKMMFTVTATPPATTGFSVEWMTSDGTGPHFAIADTDYTSANNTLNFAATDATKTIEIEILGDDSSEEDETFTVTLSNAGNGARLSATKFKATGTIIDDDKFPFISIVADSGAVGENAGPAKFMLIGRGNVPTTPIRIKATPSEDGSDFLTDTVAGTEVEIPVTFTDPDGDKVFTGEFPVDLDNDDNREATGKIQLTLKESSAVYLLEPQSETVGKITIWDDDAPELTIVGGPAVTEGPDAKATFTIVSNVMPKAPIPIQYTATSEGYIANSGIKVTADPPISFVKFDTTGKYEGTLEVNIIDDELHEPEGTIQVTLNSEATLSTYYLDETNSSNLSASVTVTDNDPIPTVSVANLTPLVVERESMITIPVTLTNPTTETVMIDWSTNVGTASANDFVAQTNQTLVISDGTTGNIVIQITSDSESEEIENFTVVLTNARGATLTEDITVTVSISDRGIPNLEFTSPTFSVSEDGDEIIVTVELTAPAIVDVTFTYELIDGTATAPDDYIIPSNLAGVISKNGSSNSITIKIENDAIKEDNETFVVRLKELNGARFASGTTLDATVTIVDDDEPVLSFRTINFETNENVGDFDIEVQISNLADDNVTFDIALDEGTATNDFDYTIPTSLQGEIALSSTSTTISIPIIDDDVEEESETFNITISNLDGAVFADGGTTLIQEITIIDNDETPQVTIEATTPNQIMEGATAVFTLSLTPANAVSADQTLDVHFNVTQQGNFILWRYKRSIPMNSAMATLEIKTHDDEVEEENGNIVVTLVDTEEYNPMAPGTAEIEITDNDDPPTDGSPPPDPEDRISVAQLVVNQLLDNPNLYQGTGSTESRAPSPVLPTVAIDAVQTIVIEGSPVEFVITSSGDSDSTATIVNLLVNPVGDFFDFNTSKQITRRIQGQDSVQVTFPTINDTIAEADGRLEVTIIPDSSYEINTSKNTAAVNVSDAEDRQLRQDLLATSTQAFLPDVVGNMAARTSDLISQRIQQGFNQSTNVTFNLGGENTLEGLIEMSGEMTNEGSVKWREVLGDSSFVMTLLSGDDFVAPTTIWGIGDYRDLSTSASINSKAWSGDVFTGQFGIDALIGQNTLTGLSTSITENDIKVGADNTEKLAFTLNTTALNPYFGWTSPTQNTELQAIASYGIGEFSINQTDYDIENFASHSYSLALSGRKELYASDSILNGITKLNVIGDSWIARNFISGQDDLLADLQTDAHYLRIRTEGTHQFSFERGSLLTPLISVGIRDDRKDQLTNFGMELTGGFDYADPIGLTLSGNGSMLYAGESTFKKLSVNGTLGYDYGDDALGLTFGISPTWGQTLASVQNTLWSNSIFASDKVVGKYSDGTQVNSEIGYGFTLGENFRKLNLYSGYEFDTSTDDELLLGTSLSIGSNLGLDFEQTNKVGSSDSAARKYQFNARLSW